MACFLFAEDDCLNALRLSELYLLSCMLDGVQLDLGSFLARQLHSATATTKGRIVIGGIVTTSARFLGVEPNLKDKVSRFGRLDQAAFEIMNFVKLRLAVYVGFTTGTSFYRFPMLLEPLYFTGLTFTGYLVTRR